jgi:hypothetical protein
VPKEGEPRDATPTPRRPRLYALLARDAPRGVVLRRGPSKQVLLVAWKTDVDTFELGQWFAGRIYERRCDLSPSGEHFLYFAAKWKGEFQTWTAVSRPPWLTALALWPKGDAWGGGGLFHTDRSILLNHRSTQMKLAPGYRLPKRLRVDTLVPPGYSEGEDSPIWDLRIKRDGWTRLSPGVQKERRTAKGLWWTYDPPAVFARVRPGSKRTELRMMIHGIAERDGPWYTIEHEVTSPHRTVSLGRSDWADWDSKGDLLFARDGRLYRVSGDIGSTPRELVDLRDMRFQGRPSPPSAGAWFG